MSRKRITESSLREALLQFEDGVARSASIEGLCANAESIVLSLAVYAMPLALIWFNSAGGTVIGWISVAMVVTFVWQILRTDLWGHGIQSIRLGHPVLRGAVCINVIGLVGVSWYLEQFLLEKAGVYAVVAMLIITVLSFVKQMARNRKEDMAWACRKIDDYL